MTEIKTKRLTLRPLGPDYLDSTFAYSGDLESTKFMCRLPHADKAETADFLQMAAEEWGKGSTQLVYEFAVLFHGRHIGAVCLYLNEEQTGAEAGWILHKDYWGQGFAFEAAEALLQFAEQALHLRLIVAHCDTENAGSRRIMEKLGMICRGVHGGRKNRSSDEERQEYQYEKELPIIGLKRGTVQIVPHQEAWTAAAEKIIVQLKEIFGEAALDIQHIGSTAIAGIKAKPILDIAVGTASLEGLGPVLSKLTAAGFQEAHNRFSSNLLYIIQGKDNVRTCQVHILVYDSLQWHNYIDFRDYLNAFPEKAQEYEALKERLAAACDNVQTAYTDGKHDYMERVLAEARAWAAQNRTAQQNNQRKER